MERVDIHLRLYCVCFSAWRYHRGNCWKWKLWIYQYCGFGSCFIRLLNTMQISTKVPGEVGCKQLIQFIISNSLILECSQHAPKHFGIGSEGLQPFAEIFFLHLLSLLTSHVNLGSLLLRAMYWKPWTSVIFCIISEWWYRSLDCSDFCNMQKESEGWHLDS